MKRQALIAEMKEPVVGKGRLIATEKPGSMFVEPDFGLAGYYGGSASAVLPKQPKSIDIQLLKKIDEAREDERRRLSRELHDQLGQDIAALSLGLSLLRRSVEHDPCTENQIEELQRLAEQVGKQIHDIALELRPTILEDLGLRMALLSLADRWSLKTGIEVICRISGLENQSITKSVETAVYRVAQEAFTNIYKHARAHKVELIVECDERRLVASIADDGIGIDLRNDYKKSELGHGLGLKGMRERMVLVSGKLKIKSVPNKGTTVMINIPLFS